MVQSTQEYTIEEVARHNSCESTWIILNSKVYDVTNFLMEHPGGDEVILEHAGKDATVGFNDVNHSSDAKQLAEDYLIGRVTHTSQKETKSAMTAATPKAGCCTWVDIIYSPTWSNFFIPAAISIGVVVAYKIAQKFASNL